MQFNPGNAIVYKIWQRDKPKEIEEKPIVGEDRGLVVGAPLAASMTEID